MNTLLVIDDEPDIHRVLGPVLTAAGWTVLSASTAAHGLRTARVNTIKVTLLDLGLPDVDGKEIIRKLHETNSMSIIVISARHQGSEKIAALDAGADDFVDKPFDPLADEYPYPVEAIDMTYDGLHPSDKGYDIIANMLIDVLK